MKTLHVKIKDDEKTELIRNLLGEFSFVEVEEDTTVIGQETNNKDESGEIVDLFGIWKDRDITLDGIRKSAWSRDNR